MDPAGLRAHVVDTIDAVEPVPGWAQIVVVVEGGPPRGRPVATLDLLAPFLAGGDVVVLLGPTSPVGAALTRRRDDEALAALEPWRDVVPAENLLLELVTHRLPGQQGGWGPGTTVHAAHTAALARRAGLDTVLTNAVRYAERPVTLRLLRTEILRCEVGDDSPQLPRQRRARETDEGGRGLFLVNRLARRWGATRLSTGKVVWFEMATP